MKLINRQLEAEQANTPEGSCYFSSPTEFGLYRYEGGVKIRYLGKMTQVGERFDVTIRKHEESADKATQQKFSIPYRSYHEEDSDLLCQLILAHLNELSPLTEDDAPRKMPDWAKYALRGLAVVIAIQVGSCVRKNYQIEKAIREEAAAASSN